MRASIAAFATVLCLACAFDGSQATDPDPFQELLAGKFTRIAICGYGDGHTSKGLPDERTLGSACEAGRNSFVVELGGLAVADAEEIVKRAIRDARRADDERAHVPCIAMLTVSLESGRRVQFFVMTIGELRSGAARIRPPKDPVWLDELTGWICKLLGCDLSFRQSRTSSPSGEAG